MASVVKEPSLATVDALDGLDAVVCLVAEDERPLQAGSGFVDFRLCGALSRALAHRFFVGSPGERLLMPSEGRLPAPMVFALGLGASKSVTALGLEHALSGARTMLEQAKVQQVALAVPPLPQVEPATAGAVIARAFVKPWTAGRVVVLADAATGAAVTP
ncbi:MAG: M17 family peptidase N-terminal domain-containing protein [Myxococcaceae bacterium]|nr:M17 family peptidase N-terminal domain-containing protein [Myxococcaceae bacterium]